jgi:hypothetical protein
MGMTQVISIHEYTLKPTTDLAEFETAILAAKGSGLLALPGLQAATLLKGIKGARTGSYAMIWTYESRPAWERLWGPPTAHRSPIEYPPQWQSWEQDVLRPFLDHEPDHTPFTAYRVVEG